MNSCQRCGKYSVSWREDEVKIVGNVTACLCAACKTELEHVVRGHPAWPEYQEIVAELAALRARIGGPRPGTKEEYLDIDKRAHATIDKFREFALDFVKPLEGAKAAARGD